MVNGLNHISEPTTGLVSRSLSESQKSQGQAEHNSSSYFAEKAGEDLDNLSEKTDTTHVPNELQADVDGRLNCCQTFRFFLKHSLRDVARRKCHFFLGLCSVLIVVLSTLVVNTVTAKGPIIFMKLA